MATPQPEARIIGKLLVLQQTLEVLPTREEQVAFIRRTLREIPGLADVRFCLLGLWVPECPSSNTTCVLAEPGDTPRLASTLPCFAAEAAEVRSMPVRTATRLYGFMILSVVDPAALACYTPYLENTVNNLANLLEKRAMGEELRQAFNELERQVQARTAELAQKNALLRREVEQRKRAEAELQQAYGALERRVRERTAELQTSEERLRAIITAAVDGIITLSDRGLVELFNPAAERLFGYTADEVLGRNITMLMPPTYRERHTAYLSHRLTPEETKYLGSEREILGLHKDGSTFPLEIAISETWIGGARKFTGILRDIAERKRAEARIRDSEAFIRRVLDNLFVFVCALLPDGTVIESNHAPLEAAGLRFEDVCGKKFWDLHTWNYSPEVRQQLKAAVEQAAEGHTSRYDVNVRVAGGALMPIDFMLAPLRDDSGRITHLIPSAIPIIERKLMEQALRDADRRKDEFLAMLAHELRNPLAPIRNAAHILRIRAKHQAEFQRPVEIIERQVVHLTRLVDDLLDVSRITRGKIELQKHPVDLATVIQRAVEVNQPLIEARHQRLIVALPAEDLGVEGDKIRLVQVVANLLNNAAKYSEDGGRIELRLERDGSTALLRVRDTGMGIAPELLPHVFDLFSQGERGLDRAQGGLGIGLSLVKSLVEMHGGRVEAHSGGPGQGSEFRVRLPLLVQAAEPRSSRSVMDSQH